MIILSVYQKLRENDDNDDFFLYKKLQPEGVTKSILSIRFNTDQPKRHALKI
jgi:hypothetical protein